MVDARDAGIRIDPAKARAVLAVATDAPRTLDALERGCRAFDLGGVWATTKASRSSAERDALDLFETHAWAAWASISTTPPTDDELVMMARLFRIVRFSMNEGEDNWREASRLIGGRLYGSEASGDAPLRDLKSIIRGMIGNGAPADRAGLLRELRRRGHNDVGAADYAADLDRLSAATDAELETIVHLNSGGLPLNRYLVEIVIPDDVWNAAEGIDHTTAPVGWDAEPASRTSSDYGTRWARTATSLLLRVPSVIVPEESNVLINPRHPGIAAIKARKVRKWIYDPRIVRSM